MSAGLPRKKVEVITWFVREARSSAVKPSAGLLSSDKAVKMRTDLFPGLCGLVLSDSIPCFSGLSANILAHLQSG